MNAQNLSRRFKACYYLSAINLAAMAVPSLRPPYHVVLSILGIVVNIAACWWILRGVEPSRDPDAHERLAAFGKRGIVVLGTLGGILLTILAFTDRLGKQAVPFMLFGFGYFSVALKVLETSTRKRMDELSVEP